MKVCIDSGSRVAAAIDGKLRVGINPRWALSSAGLMYTGIDGLCHELNPFATASFFAPLTSSLALTRGTGSATFTRATTATVMGFAPDALPGAAQVLLSVAAGEVRFTGARRISQGVWSDYYADGTLIHEALRLGYLAEGAATNLFLNSAVGVTQTTPTLTAAAYTLSFKGTGTITGTGGFIGTITGTGVSDRVSLTVTATAATATLTVTGSCTEVMFNLGELSSYVPTTSTAVTLNADVDTYPTAGNIGTTGTVYLEFTPTHAPYGGFTALWSTGVDVSNYTYLFQYGTSLYIRKVIAGSIVDTVTPFVFVAGATYKIAARFGASGQQLAINGVVGTANADANPVVLGSTMQIGANYTSTAQPTANIRNFHAWTDAKTDAQLVTITS